MKVTLGAVTTDVLKIYEYFTVNTLTFRLHACSPFISQDERMSVSRVETLEKALGLHFISKMVLTCL